MTCVLPRLTALAVALHAWCALQRTVLAMTRVGLPPPDREAIFRTVAAILNLGNIALAPAEGGEASVLQAGVGEHYAQCAGAAGEVGGGGGTERWVGLARKAVQCAERNLCPMRLHSITVHACTVMLSLPAHSCSS